jgi:hypothetical protein
MAENKRNEFDFATFNPQAVIDEIKKDAETKGSLDITELANAAVGQSPLLKAIEDVVGEPPFAYVMKSSYDDSVKEVRVRLNSDLILAQLPEQLNFTIKALATKIEREEVNSSMPVFQALKRAVCSELTKAILVESKGSVQLTWDANFGTDFKFTHHHTSDAKKASIEERREAKEAANTGGKRVSAMRTKFRRPGKA